MTRATEHDKKIRKPAPAPEAPRGKKALEGKKREFVVSAGCAIFGDDRKKYLGGSKIMLTAPMARFHQKLRNIEVEIRDFDDDDADTSGDAASIAGSGTQATELAVSPEDDEASPDEVDNGDVADAGGAGDSSGDSAAATDEAPVKRTRRRR